MVNQPDTTILSDKEGISSSHLVNMPTYSPRNGVTTGTGNRGGKVYIKVIDENHPEGYTETKLLAEEVYNSEDGDIVIVGYANQLRNLATEAFKASLRYIENELLPDTPHETLWHNVDPEWERETISRLAHLIHDEIDRNPDVPEYVAQKLEMKEKDIHGIADDVGYLYDRWQDERGMPGEEFVHYRNYAQKKVEARKAEFQSLEAEPFVLKFKKGKSMS